MRTGKFVTLMAPAVPLFLRAVPDIALLAMHKPVIGQATLAADVFGGEVLAIGQGALAGDAAPV